MEAIFKKILKESKKIIRILIQVTEQHPKLSEQVSPALYASIQIEKAVNKYMQSGASNQYVFTAPIDEYKITRNDDSQDAFFNAAMQSIQNFRESTFKLQRKINVLINQEEFCKIRKPAPSQSIYPVDINPPQKNMRKKARNKQIVEQESKSLTQQQSDNDSTHLSVIDASIVKILNQIELHKKRQKQYVISSRKYQDE